MCPPGGSSFPDWVFQAGLSPPWAWPAVLGVGRPLFSELPQRPDVTLPIAILSFPLALFHFGAAGCLCPQACSTPGQGRLWGPRWVSAKARTGQSQQARPQQTRGPAQAGGCQEQGLPRLLPFPLPSP